MSIQQTFVAVLVLLTSSVVLGQTTETRPTDSSNSATSSGQSATIRTPNPCGSGATGQAEVLTDTMGVDFGPYLTRITKIVRQSWYSLMPLEVYPPTKKQGKVSVEFVILKDGRVNGMKLNTGSGDGKLNIALGDVALDRAAWGGITAFKPFPPLPSQFPGHTLGLRFYFYYNLEPT